MPLLQPGARPVPDFWNIYGHSWFQFQTGPSGDQTGRVDALFRSAMDIEYNNWRNFAFSGARVCGNSRSLGGWTRLIGYRGISGRVGPYAPDGGGTVICWGINDLGQYGGQNTATRTTIVDALRACISRCRASTIHEDNNNIATRFAYGAGFTNVASGNDLSSGGTVRQATTTTSATITYTIPADYKGETIAWAFLKRPGATGGTLTWSGTALSGHPDNAGTFYVGGGGQSVTEHSYTVKRFTGLTAANAGQTIIGTVTSVDATTPSVFFDCAWLESLTPPPVLICDVAKLTLAGYNNALYGTWSVTQTRGEALMDGDVNALNTAIYAMVAEFDGMVQVAYCDQALNPGGVKDATKTSDGIHPNEFGAGAIVDALVDARNRLTPPATAFGYTLAFNGPSPRAAGLRRPRLVNYYHAPDYDQITYTTYTPSTVGHMFALPFNITEARDTYMKLALEVTTAGTGQASIRWAIYDDIMQSGYPQEKIVGMDPTALAVAQPTLATGKYDSANLNSGFGFVADPGLYWLVLKVDVATSGTNQVWRGLSGQSTYLPTRSTAGTGTTLNAGWQLTGQAAGVLPGSFPTGATLATTVPLIQIFRSK